MSSAFFSPGSRFLVLLAEQHRACPVMKEIRYDAKVMYNLVDCIILGTLIIRSESQKRNMFNLGGDRSI